MISSPMLAAKSDGKDLATLKFPVLATPKLDGIRCEVIVGKALSRRFKAIPNDHIRKSIEKEFVGYRADFDGELIVKGRDFNDLSGDVRRVDGTPDFQYCVFDHVLPNSPKDGFTWGGLAQPYHERIQALATLSLPNFCRKILPVEIQNFQALQDYEQECLASGYEGIMVRAPNGPYKCGRSTWNEGYLIKIKRFEDDEATIVGWEEEMQNNNPATEDAFGRTERSSHQENLVGKGTLGKLICTSPKWPKEFGIGTGFSAKLRDELWAKRHELKGKLVKFKHQQSGAGKDRPRIPVFLGFRDEWDT